MFPTRVGGGKQVTVCFVDELNTAARKDFAFKPIYIDLPPGIVEGDEAKP